MTPMVKVSLLAGPALISAYVAHPERVVALHGPVMDGLERDLMDLLNLPDPALIPSVVWKDLRAALERGTDSPGQHQQVAIGLTHPAGRHPMFKGRDSAPIMVRVSKC